MPIKIEHILFTIVFFLLNGTIVQSVGQARDTTPRVFLLDAKTLSERKKNASTSSLKPALDKLDRDAKKALAVEVRPVTAKTVAPPSGDKHDYMSQAPYFWKDPSKKDGLPYIRRDGERNPEILLLPDKTELSRLVSTLQTLSLGFYFTGKEEYAERSAKLLRMWFLDAKTKMNPSLQFAQAIPGVNTGRGIGIIETHGLVNIADAVGLIGSSASWTKSDQLGMEDWFDKYLKWLTESKYGRDEAAAKNNHGTIYDVQVASFALFTRNRDLATRVLESSKQNRIAKQIEPDGSQPLELARSLSWNYSAMNLGGYVELARLGEVAGVDLWTFKTADGRSIRKALEFLLPFADGKKKWEHKQIQPLVGERLYNLMRIARHRYTDDAFKSALAVSTEPPADARERLVR